MKISIITIAWNSAATIEDTIQSVLKQDYPEIEYIIVDGDSSDGTQDIIERYKDRIATYLSEPDKGIYDAMNKGVSLSTGDVVGILNSDDFYADAHVISDVVRQLEKTNADGIYADLVYVDREDPNKIKRYWKSGEYQHGKFKRGWMPPHPTFFVRKSCYDKFGTYTLALRSAADYELMLRFIHKHRIRMSYLSRVIIKMREGGESNVTLRNRIRANKEDRKAWRMNDLQPGPLTLTLKPLRKLGQFLVRKTT